jgi:hypothetical protein
VRVSCAEPHTVTARLLAVCVAWVTVSAYAQEDYSFDVVQYEKKAFEFTGYAELRAERFWLDQDAALYQLNFFDQEQRAQLDRLTGAAELTGIYRHGIATAQATVHGEAARDELESDSAVRLYEGLLALEPAIGTSLGLGKRTLRWGKGYAFNPVGFVERVKDPNEPELSREGFVMLGGSFTRSFDGALRTVTFQPLVVPTADHVNEDFGSGDYANPAARLSLLYYDTDIDFHILGEGARSMRYGVDFSRNLSTNLEVHGEWAYLSEVEKPVMDAAGTMTRTSDSAQSYLLGLRYLSESEITTIAEYYYNGAGYSEEELRDYFTFVHAAYDQFLATGDATLLARASSVQSAYVRPNPGRRYLYVRSSWKEPFDILYVTPSFTVIANLDDSSFQVTPELAYTGITNIELRFRLFFLSGDRLTDFGEKPSDHRLELRLRYYF